MGSLRRLRLTGIRGFTTRSRLAGLVTAVVGYVLSPASWWNDAFVNIPLALVMARVFMVFVHSSFDVLFLVSYWITNILGIVLMAVGGSAMAGRGVGWRSVLIGLLVATVYSVIVFFLLRLLSL